MNARKLLEAPMDFGDAPDFVDPARKRKIEREEHPYKDIKAFPKKPGVSHPTRSATGHAPHPQPGSPRVKSYADLAASEAYVDTVRRLSKYTGIPVAQVHPGAVSQMLQQAMGNVMRVQARHARQLEQKAVEVVLSLPEFESLNAAIQSGDVKIDAKLSAGPIDPEGLQASPEEMTFDQQQELEVAEIAQQFNAEKAKRRMINLMIQGASVDKTYAFHLMGEFLNGLSPNLVNQMGLVMAFGDFLFWIMPSDARDRARMGPGGEASPPMGKSWLEFHDDGTVTVHAAAGLLPLLIHELVKGLMDLLAHNPDDPDDLRKQIQGQTDTTENEEWDLPMGAPIWRQVERMIGDDNRRYMPQVFTYITHLPPDQFGEFLEKLLRGDAGAQREVQRIVAKAKAEPTAESADVNRLVDRLLD